MLLVLVGGQSYDEDQSWIEFSDPQNAGGTFQHLLVDLRPGRLYVSATNRLYQLDGRLMKIEAVATTGPQADNPLCPPPPTADCHDAERVPTDAISKALALDQRDQRLIVCTNLFQVPSYRQRCCKYVGDEYKYEYLRFFHRVLLEYFLSWNFAFRHYVNNSSTLQIHAKRKKSLFLFFLISVRK